MPEVILADAPRTECMHCGSPIALAQQRGAGTRERWVHLTLPFEVRPDGSSIVLSDVTPSGTTIQVSYGTRGCRAASFDAMKTGWNEELDSRWMACPTKQWRAAHQKRRADGRF